MAQQFRAACVASICFTRLVLFLSGRLCLHECRPLPRRSVDGSVPEGLSLDLCDGNSYPCRKYSLCEYAAFVTSKNSKRFVASLVSCYRYDSRWSDTFATEACDS